MAKKICLLTDHHISVNPRLWKEAFFYESCGYEVMILSMWASAESLAKDEEIIKGKRIRYSCYLNMIPGSASFFHRTFYRLRKRIATDFFRLTGIASKWTISYAPEKMIRAALKEQAHLYAAHLECAFYAGVHLAKKGKKVSFDFEDWYSRDYLLPGRPAKLLSTLEKKALRCGIFCTTTSKSMKKALEDAYGKAAVTFEVIYNGFLKCEERLLIQRTNNKDAIPKLLWFSRTVGPGRGIERIIETLKSVDLQMELHLLGNIDTTYKQLLQDNFPFQKGHHLIFHSFIPHQELDAFISIFDIGFATEETVFDSRNFTITNKMLQYLQAGIKVLATDTDGQREVASYFPHTVRTVSNSDIESWSHAITALLTVKNKYREEQIQLFEFFFSWESQQEKLKSLITLVL